MMKYYFLLCFLLLSGAIKVVAQPLGVSVSTVNSCQNNGSATCVATGGVPPYQYYWFKWNNASWSPQFTSSISGLSPGVYNIKVTDATGTSVISSAAIKGMAEFYITTSPDTCNLSKGYATPDILSGTGPYTYQWHNGSTNDTAFNLPAGHVSLILTDINGCYTNSLDLEEFFPSMLVNEVFNTSSFTIDNIQATNSNCTNGTATVNVSGGVLPYSYSWSTLPVQTTQTATNLKAQTIYYVTVTDATGCTNNGIVSIPTNTNLSVIATVNPDTCYAGNGSISIVPVGGTSPYSIIWSNGSTGNNLINLNTDSIYAVTVTDVNGCVDETAFLINEYSPLNISVSSIPSSCSAATGSITASVSGGAAPYTYSWLTNPVQSTATATGLFPGDYHILVSDANGCTRQSTIVLADTSALAINITNVSPETCMNANGSATVNVAGGLQPYQYSWNSSPVQTTAIASGLSYGRYKVIVTDAQGCIRNANAVIGRTLPLQISETITDASCIFIADGQISVLVSGGAAPYSYQWSNGAGSSAVSGLLPGYYYLAVTDANGCIASKQLLVRYTSLSPCASEIKGNVYADANSDCMCSMGEYYLDNVKVSCTPLGGYKFTDNTGQYSFIIPNTGNYDLDMILPLWYDWSCGPRPKSVNVSSLGSTFLSELPLSGNALDMTIHSYNNSPARPGFNFSHQVSYHNLGSVADYNMLLKINYDPQLNFTGSTLVPVTVDPVKGELTFNVFGQPGSGISKIDLNFTVNPSMPIGYQLTFVDSLFTNLPDTLLLNNYYTANEFVVGAFDPNDISVSPPGIGVPGYIGNSDSLLTYTVRFQNTGNYPATNVVVKILSDSDLDLNSLEYLGGTFPAQIEVSASGEITVSFIGIFLPDSIMNEAESHGSFAFRVKQKPGLIPGTPISLFADIYFDFNTPVTTNTTLNTITGVSAIHSNTNSITVYPVPASDQLNVKMEKNLNAGYAEVCDIAGRILQTIALAPGETEFKVDVSGLPSGLYMLNIKKPNSFTCRFIKE